MIRKLLFSFVVSLCSLTLAAQQGITIGDYVYNFENGEATLVKPVNRPTGEVVVPATVFYDEKDYPITSLGNGCFSDCGSLTSIDLPDGVKSLGSSCFSGCANLTSIDLPNSITSIGDYCFHYCKSLTSVNLPSGITSLENGSFGFCLNLASIDLPDGITFLGSDCFQNCESLTSVDLPGSLTYMGNNCFNCCRSLASIYLPEDIKTLGNGCFSNCSSLASINLPNSITSMGDGCFSGCSSLASIGVPDGITVLGIGCFTNCNSLTSVDLPNGLTMLAEYCFMGCSSLASIDLPSTITSIRNACFRDCTGLTSIDLPASIKGLYNHCFYGCIALSSVKCHWESWDGVSIITDGLFGGIPAEATLYVPEGTTELYQSREPWTSSFKNIVEFETETPEQPTPQCACPTVAFENNKLQFTSTTEGAQFHYTIVAPDAKENVLSADGVCELACKYNITAYASAEGHTNSETVTATLYFIAQNVDDETAINTPTQRGIVVSATGGYLTINGLKDGESISIYSVGGSLLAKPTVIAGTATYNGTSGDIVIVKIGEQSIKVQL